MRCSLSFLCMDRRADEPNQQMNLNAQCATYNLFTHCIVENLLSNIWNLIVFVHRLCDSGHDRSARIVDARGTLDLLALANQMDELFFGSRVFVSRKCEIFG